MYGEAIRELEKLPDKAKEILFENSHKLSKDILDNIAVYCSMATSPIEKILITALQIETRGVLYLDPQCNEKCDKKNYYIDIAIYGDENINAFLKKDFRLAIECDGYEFHQKTKKQVDYDNQREYDLKMNGFEILRFSGSEIYKSPIECAWKIMDYITKNGVDNDE